jgi:hypothetical protein
MRTRAFAVVVCIVTALLVCGLSSCETYDSPPRPAIEGLVDGILADRTAPIVVRFNEPIDPETLRVSVIKYEIDEEGRLNDERPEPLQNTEYFAHDPLTGNEHGGALELIDDDTAFRIWLKDPLPVGPSLAVLIEPGLADLERREQKNRLRLLFSYKIGCDTATPTTLFPSGYYIIFANVDEPIMTQIQLWGRIEVDASTGTLVGQFTNADRNPDPNRCSPPCASTEACRLLPAEECVLPSTEAGGADEYPDWVPNSMPPTGYSFRVEGCLSEMGTTVTMLTLPTDVVIQQPAVTVEGIEVTVSFAPEGDVLRGTGSVTANNVIIGTTPSGPAKGTVIARQVPDAEAPPDVPVP